MRKYVVISLVLLVAFVAYAQQKVDQGKPGTFGPWPVTTQTPVWPSDGGSPTGITGVGMYPYPCAADSPMRKYLMDGGAQIVGTTGTGRIYIVVQNTGDDLGGGSNIIKCRSDNVAPTLTAGTPGTLLPVGASVVYTNPEANRVRCIGVSVYAGTFECEP